MQILIKSTKKEVKEKENKIIVSIHQCVQQFVNNWIDKNVSKDIEMKIFKNFKKIDQIYFNSTTNNEILRDNVDEIEGNKIAKCSYCGLKILITQNLEECENCKKKNKK